MNQWELRNYSGYNVKAEIFDDTSHTTSTTYIGVLSWRYWHGNTMLFSIDGTDAYDILANRFKTIKILKA